MDKGRLKTQFSDGLKGFPIRSRQKTRRRSLQGGFSVAAACAYWMLWVMDRPTARQVFLSRLSFTRPAPRLMKVLFEKS